MPTVLRVGGFAFRIYPDDHDPPHVHVRYAGKKCKSVLSTLDVVWSTMNASELARATAITGTNREVLQQAWTEAKQRHGRQR